MLLIISDGVNQPPLRLLLDYSEIYKPTEATSNRPSLFQAPTRMGLITYVSPVLFCHRRYFCLIFLASLPETCSQGHQRHRGNYGGHYATCHTSVCISTELLGLISPIRSGAQRRKNKRSFLSFFPPHFLRAHHGVIFTYDVPLPPSRQIPAVVSVLWTCHFCVNIYFLTV